MGIDVSELEVIKDKTVAEIQYEQDNLAELYEQDNLAELCQKLRDVNQAIYEKTPRDLSLAEVERLLGFKVNIVEGDKLWIHD